MKPLTGLRCVDRLTQQLGNTCVQLRLAGYDPTTDVLLTGTRYLRFSAKFSDRSEMIGYVDLRDWLTRSMPELEGIDWLSIDEALLPTLVAAIPLQLDLVHQHATIDECQVSQLLADQESLRRLPRVASNHGWLLVEHFQAGPQKDIGADEQLAQLPMRLEFQVGQSRLPLRSLSSVELGDILLVDVIRQRVVSNAKTLFAFALHGESIMITEPEEGIDADFPEFDDYHADAGAEPVEPTGSPLSQSTLSALPVELSFVLMEKSVTLAELQTMLPGQIVDLPKDQLCQVDIRVNHQPFARGELVQLADGQLGVEIHRTWS